MIGTTIRSWYLYPVQCWGGGALKCSDIDQGEDGRRGHCLSLLVFYQGPYHFVVSSCIIVTGGWRMEWKMLILFLNDTKSRIFDMGVPVTYYRLS
jgi:hypothetical protein